MTGVKGARQGAEVIPLRRFPSIARPCSLEIADGLALLRLPGIFGAGHPLTVPLANLAVVHRAGLTSLERGVEAGDGLVFLSPVNLPYLWTSSLLQPPNLQLLFAEPVLLPKVRLGGTYLRSLSYWASRSPSGAIVDGVALRALDPDAAVAQLVSAGAAPVTDPVRWLTDRRATTDQPGRVAAVREQEHRLRRIDTLSWVTLPMMLGTAWWGGALGFWWPVPLVAAEAVAGIALPGWFKRRLLRGAGRTPTTAPS